MKLCECGCGEKTPPAKHTSTRDKTVKGKPVRYINGHSLKRFHGAGEKHPSYKTGKFLSSGYLKILLPDHPNATHRYIPNSHLVVEKAIGKFLPKEAMVHHVDGIRSNDKNTNLVACENLAYHNLLHRRHRAFGVCGHANWRKCRYCGNYDDPKNMYQEPARGRYTDSCRHRKCYNAYMRKYNARNKSAAQKTSRTAKRQGVL